MNAIPEDHKEIIEKIKPTLKVIESYLVDTYLKGKLDGIEAVMRSGEEDQEKQPVAYCGRCRKAFADKDDMTSIKYTTMCLSCDHVDLDIHND